jgi:ribosomal protein S18 acetylase RimI-like enzyme
MTQNRSTSKGNVIIRNATIQDAAELFDLRLEALTTQPENFAADVQMTESRGVQAWVDQLNNDARTESGVIMIARAAGELIGMAGVGRGHWPKTRHSAIIWGVYVQPAWRGLRIAEALLEGCMGWAQVHEIVVLKLGVVTTNSAAIHCYERCGFTVYGTEPKAIQIDGVFFDEYMMARTI